MVLETVVRVRLDSVVERLVCHPRLPLVAGFDAERPAIHVWDTEELRQVGSVGAESAGYGNTEEWERRDRKPLMAWHPDQPLLVVKGEDGVRKWTPDGQAELPDVASSYYSLAFSPDGRTLWASPTADGGDDAWKRSDVIDLATGTIGTGPGWDTGIAKHPAGGLVVTYQSDQGATYGLFARVDDKMRILRRALILDADGYRTPIFSPDGRHIAIRGNSYEHSLEVFEFPSLQRVLATVLGEPNPGYPYPDEWLDGLKTWSMDNVAFGAQPGVIWIGTPAGTLVEFDIAGQTAAEHEVLASPVSALTATRDSELIVASKEGELVRLSTGSATTASHDTVTAFLDATSDVPEDDDMERHLVVTDGAQTWSQNDLETVTAATDTDPTWLQLRAAINNARQ